MAKIQLKKSTILSGGNALEPTNTQMLFGELAVNYNADDPCIFFKNSDDSVIRIAGKNAIGNRAIDIEGYPTLTDGLGAELDDRYLKLNSSGTQIIGTTGLTEFSGGIKVADSETHLLELSEGGSSKVVVTNDGKMGVGTSTPTNVLQVVGTVAATAATISSNLTAAQIISTVADGTAPLSVTSTTAVDNLNADAVDGLHANSFLRSDQDDVANNKITFADEITANSDIKLITDSKIIFGSNELDMYADSNDSFNINNKTDTIRIQNNGTNVIIIDTPNKTIKPGTDNTGSIGTSSRKWNAVYVQDINSAGTITANVINATTITGAINASNLTGTIDTARLPATYTLAEEITINATGSLGYLALNADKNIGLTTSGSSSFIRFRGNNGQGSYRFTKAGQSTIEGFLDFESLTADRTFTFPNVSGTVALTSSTVSNADNADKVDNLHASSFLRSDADDVKTGNLILNTASNTKHLYIGRYASTVNEYTKIGRDDSSTIFYTKNDENSSRVVFQFENTDTEGANVGANASNRTIKLISNQTNASITVEDNLVWHEGNDGAGSSLDADLLDGQHGAYYTNYTDTAISNLIDSSPGTLNTLNELASALGDDANFSTTITNSLATKLPLAGGAMTGNITFSGTQTVDGRDLSVDGSKLDGIETNATADQTAAEILTLLKTVDTNSSGLNADKLDGQEGSYYQAASTAVNTSTTFGGDVVGTYNSLAIVNDSHTHDTRYFTETEADARFLGITAKAADADKLDNLDSGSFLRSDSDDTYSGIITGNRLLLGGSQIITSTAKLQVNGFMETGNINIHEGGNSPNSNYKVLSNNGGVLEWDGDTVWTSSNNGAGTGLNADQVDGYEGADLLKSSEDDSFSGNLTGSGTIYTTGNLMGIKGNGGGVCLTTNDGGGNANVAFNHQARVPDQSGSSGRITCSVDDNTAAMNFQLKDNVTAGTTVGLTTVLGLTQSTVEAFGNTVWHAGNDGALSTLDADLLDGQHGSYYTGYTDTAIANLIASSPSSLNTLNELAAALGDDANFSTTITDSIGLKLPKTGGTMSGNIVFTGSQTVDGRDLSVDGSKLDGIEAGATGDLTASEILNLLKTVDTNSSGLNADTVDGYNASSFLKSDANDTASGDITFTGEITIEDNLLKIGDTSNNNYSSFQHATSDGYGFTWEFNRGSVIINEQGTTNQALVLGDVSATSGKSGLFGIAHTSDSGSTWTKKLDLQGDGELFIGTSGTSKVWHAGNHGATSTLDADLLDGQEGSFYQNATNLTSGTIPDARIPDSITPLTRVTTAEVLGSGTNLTIAAEGSGKDLVLRAADMVYINAGLEEDGAILFRGTSGGDSYRFAKSGQTAIEGFLSMESLTANRTFTFPDAGGTIALTTSTVSGNLALTGGTLTGNLTLDSGAILNNNDDDAYDKIRVWNDSFFTIGMKSAQTHGDLNDYAMTFTMNNDNDRGWLWRDTVHDASGGAMSLSTRGGLCVSRGINVGGGETDTGYTDYPLHVDNSLQTGLNNSYSTVFIDADWTGAASHEVDGVSVTGFSANRSQYALRVDQDNSRTNTTSVIGNRQTIYGIGSNSYCTEYTHGNYAVHGVAESTGAGDGIGTQSVYGVYGHALAYVSSGACNSYGGYFLSYRGGTTSGGTLYGVYARAENTTSGSGKSGNAYGGYFEVECDQDTIGSAVAVRAIIDHNGGTITTGTLFSGKFQGTIGTKWGVYIEDETNNYFSGNLGIGTTAPGTKLDVNGNIHCTKLAAGTSANPGSNLDICLGVDDDTGFSVPSDGNLKFWCNNNEVASWTASALTFENASTFNGRVSIRGDLDLSDGENLDFGSSVDVRINYNSNNWLYCDFRTGNGIAFRDNGVDTTILEDSGIFRPQVSGTGSLGTDTRLWGASYFTAATLQSTSSQLLIHNPDDETVIHRNDGGIYYILLSDAGTNPSGTWNTLRPFLINLQTGKLISENSQEFKGGTSITNSALVVESDIGNSITLGTKVGNGNDSTFIFQKARGGSGSPSQITASDDLGEIIWQGYDGSSYTSAASIKCKSTSNTGDFDASLLIGAGGVTSSFSSSGLAVTGEITATGSIKSSSNLIEVGEGGGGVALTINDGQGNANVTFNHAMGVPDQSGSSARIQSTVDSTNARLIFELQDSVTQDVSVNPTNIMTMDIGAVSVTGSISATADITAYSSDRRLKENFRSIEDPIDKIKKLNGYVFDWNEKSAEVGFNPRRKKDEVGLIAQEVQDVIPQAVAPAPFDSELNHEGSELVSLSGENYLTVQYEKLVPLLIESIKEQQSQINELRQEINNLKGDK